MNSKRGAMEMSTGTLVVIVLSMAVLVLGIFFIQQIFGVATTAISGVDERVQSEIETLFGEDKESKIATIPRGSMSISQGSRGGFALSIRNIRDDDEIFSYEIKHFDNTCGLDDATANGLIQIGREYHDIDLPSGQSISGRFVEFRISENIPLCTIVYDISVTDKKNRRYDEGDQYRVEIV